MHMLHTDLKPFPVSEATTYARKRTNMYIYMYICTVYVFKSVLDREALNAIQPEKATQVDMEILLHTYTI